MNYEALEQCFASAVAYIHSHSGISTPPYFDELPESFYVPSIYFPVPWTRVKKASLSSYRSQITLTCRFMASEDWEAYQMAMNVRDCILRDGMAIRMLNKDGTCTRNSVRIEGLEIRRVEFGTVQLQFDINHYFSYQEDSEMVQNLIISGVAKSSDLYNSWRSATQALRNEQEVAQRCLQKAIQNL